MANSSRKFDKIAYKFSIMKIIKLNKNNTEEILKNSLRVLNNGGLVVFPTDTVYGLLADTTNKDAVSKLIKFKNRPPGKAISIFIADFKMLAQQVTINNSQLAIIHKILPGPFTIILPSKHKVKKSLESENGTLGVRFPDNKLVLELVKKYRKPVTATSANLAGNSPHYSSKSFLATLTDKKEQLIDLLVDTGRLPKNKPSTIVDLTESNIKVLRKGDVEFKNSITFLSKAAEETKKIAFEIISNEVRNLSERKSKRPLVFIIEGELGVGKTVLVKGMGEFLNIKNIVSPTYVIYYEYGNFFHYDLYNVTEKIELDYLAIEKNLKSGNILCFEWGEKAGEIIDLLKSKAEIVYVRMSYVNERERKIIICNI